MANDTPGGCDALFSNRDTGANQGPGTDPSSIIDMDRSRNCGKTRVSPVVIASTKVNALGNTDIVSYVNPREIVDPTVFSDPAGIANRQSPRVFDANAGLDYNIPPDARAEESQ
jgi:hypothetical protein